MGHHLAGMGVVARECGTGFGCDGLVVNNELGFHGVFLGLKIRIGLGWFDLN
jgi:hypothetical protein